ncbi:PAS domain-containing protein [Methanoculleus sp. Wushi-C6]|uniref:protein-glutamate O-methyltransferase n=2 Tax=Methanoculleus caldifontis TaxID=2651577 RepID=A0ABU3X4G2_9EURY|nr:PAS domain-containing protein [Methanoculleus sp. Wushi-C6]
MPAVPAPEALRAIVGIGASAGGLEALEQFFTHMPADTGMAFVLVTHMDPNQKGMLPELIQRVTEMPVMWAEDGMAVAPNAVYVKPANADLAILHGTLNLLEPVATRMSRTPIDLFFRYLAEDQDGRAVGIVLSGMGHDGTQGVRAIKEKLGAVLVQEPTSASYSSMPENAIATGLADYVAPAAELPRLLTTYIRSADTIAREPAAPTRTMVDGLKKVFILIRTRTGQDFSMYKQNTIRRRIERRMGLHQLTRIEDYVRYLQENPQETEILAKELLIGVTRFFRDPDAWQALQEKKIRDLVRSAPEGSVIRVWVAGCSTGEEAYTMAIVLRECLDAQDRHGEIRYQIFATDLDEEAIEVARHGRYVASIAADVSPERLERYFVREDEHYRIRQEIRETIVFAQQNIITAPPFIHLDILCCRNLLIYLSGELQEKLIPVFHYALKPGGVLFLGTAETIGSYGELFITVDSRQKIFRRRETSAPIIDRINIPATSTLPAGTAGIRERHPTPVDELAPRALLERFAPPAVIVNENGDILYIHGKTGKYLEPSPGRANLNIHAMVREGLGYPLITALRSARQEKKGAVTEPISVKTNGDLQKIRLTVEPIERSGRAEDLFLVAFEDVEEAETKQAREVPVEVRDDVRCAELERDLTVTREQLRSTIEEMQASQEVERSMNEELQSMNEELQSTNEELTTSKEELQSLNEELLTVNSELQTKIDELSTTTDDLQNLLRGTGIPMLFLDSNLRVRRFTRAVTGIISLRSTDLDRPVTDLAVSLRNESLIGDVREVLDTLLPLEKQVQTVGGQWFQMRILPYRTASNQIDGVVITFVEITQIKELERSLRDARTYAEKIIETIREPLVVLDVDLRVVSANRSFYRTFRVTPGETEGRLLYTLGSGQWDLSDLRRLLEEILPEKVRFEGFEVTYDFPEIGQKKMRLNARRIASETGPDLILLAIEDVTASQTGEIHETAPEER